MAIQQECIAHLDGYMQKFPNTTNPQWYVGIAEDARNRLFNDHNVDEARGAWAFIQADTSTVARAVEQSYLNAGCDGGGGGGTVLTTYAYVYLKTLATDP